MTRRWSRTRARTIIGERKRNTCPACRKHTHADANGERRCPCGWHERMTLALPPRPRVIDPTAEVRKTKGE